MFQLVTLNVMAALDHPFTVRLVVTCVLQKISYMVIVIGPGECLAHFNPLRGSIFLTICLPDYWPGTVS